MELKDYWDKFLGLFGFLSDDKEYNNKKPRIKSRADSKVVSISKNQDFKLVFYKPESFDEIKDIADKLKNRKAVILNLEQLDHNNARRFIDFMSGAVYGLEGRIQKIANGVFIFTPSNIKLDGKDIEESINNNSFISN